MNHIDNAYKVLEGYHQANYIEHDPRAPMLEFLEDHLDLATLKANRKLWLKARFPRLWGCSLVRVAWGGWIEIHFSLRDKFSRPKYDFNADKTYERYYD